ncbi:MAG: hypothetical protein HYT72_03755 [Candidatus Aenigmarchaeota archaeon]|nr:hypothetical protein [Candidatus Aenigmarchaeota archaeon]
MREVRRDTMYLGVIAVLAVAAALLFFQSQKTQPVEIQSVKEIYKILTERDPEILSVKDENGLYKVTVRLTDVTGRSAVQDVFLTKDGVLFTDQPLVKVGDYISSLNRQKNFSACLTSKNVQLLGQGDNLLTFQRLLGLFAVRNYFDCTANQQSLQQCQLLGKQAGAESVPAPAVVFNNTIYPGFRDASFVGSLTGCAL